MRDTSIIKKDIAVLESELAEADAIERHNQFLILVHDDLDACTDFEKLRKFIKEDILPHVYPAPTQENE